MIALSLEFHEMANCIMQTRYYVLSYRLVQNTFLRAAWHIRKLEALLLKVRFNPRRVSRCKISDFNWCMHIYDLKKSD